MRLLVSRRMSGLYERRSWSHRAELAHANARLQEIQTELQALKESLARIERDLSALWGVHEGDRLSRCALFEVKQKEGVLLSKRLDLSTNLTQAMLRADAAMEQVQANQIAFSQASQRAAMYSKIFNIERAKQALAVDAALESEVQEMVR